MASKPYSSAVKNLMYAMVCTRPDIARAVGTISRFLSNLGKQSSGFSGIIKVFLNVCLCYGGANLVLEGYIDAYIVRDLDDRKSTFGYFYTFEMEAVS